MIHPQEQDAFITRDHRLFIWFSYLIILAVAIRRITELNQVFSISSAIVFLAIFTFLYATRCRISRRYRAYIHIYFLLQTTLVQILGIFQTFQDTWPLLYLLLAYQAAHLQKKAALIWWGVFTLLSWITLSFEFGPLMAPGPVLIYIAVGAIVISYDIQYSQHEEALAESQLLLIEIQEAHGKLEQFLSKAEELSAAQERNRVARELYDSVGQKVFAIQLAAEAVRLKLESHPGESMKDLNDLQEQTQTVLGQMRQLIVRWRPRDTSVSP